MSAYYRNVIKVEILSCQPLHDDVLTDLQAVHYETTEGGSSGVVTRAVSNEPVGAERMAELLLAQGSDPSFLIMDGDET
jgi:hypothetical protein